MLSDDRPGPTIEDGVAADAKPACVALVPVVPAIQWLQTPCQPLSRPDSTFLTHLIATAGHAPQTCSLRRATPADAQTAYTASQHATDGAGIRTRQLV
jgi:hypothetical protein